MKVGVISDTLFSAVVVMVIVTTLLAPELLTWSLRDRGTQPVVNTGTLHQ